MRFLSQFSRAAGALGVATLLAVAPTAGAQLPVSAAYSCGPSGPCSSVSFTIANPFATTLQLNTLSLFSTGGAFLFAADASGATTYGGADDLGILGPDATVSGNGTALFIDFTGGGAFPAFTLNGFSSGYVDVQLTGTPALQSGVFSYSAQGASDVTFRGNVSVAVATNVVPEPSTYLLMATGLGGIALAARRRRVQN